MNFQTTKFRRNQMDKHYAISLFSGAGGLDLGVEAAGFTTKLCTDIDSFSCETLKKNQKSNPAGLLKEANIVQRNIKEYSSDEILADAGLSKNQVDLVYGGPPCQAFSVFGKRLGLEDGYCSDPTTGIISNSAQN
jgi:DNA (cytosine-5)-methyltransferase 1